MKSTPPYDVLESVSAVAVGAPFTFEGESFYAINNHFKCCGNGTINWSVPTMKKRGVTCVLLNEYIHKGCPKSGSSCSGT